MAEDLAELEQFLGDKLAKLAPAQRRKISRKIGQNLRRANSKRIAANVQPDGSPMEARKPRPRRGRGRMRSQMFNKLRAAKSLKIRATAEEVEIAFDGSAGRIARVHHYGLSGFVGRTASGRIVRAKYPERALLGFAAGDVAEIREAVLELLID